MRGRERMDDQISYEGYFIQSAPYHLEDNGHWSLAIHIWSGDRKKIRKFFADDIFATREEAVAHGFDFGKQIIDGKVEGKTVNDL